MTTDDARALVNSIKTGLNGRGGNPPQPSLNLTKKFEIPANAVMAAKIIAFNFGDSELRELARLIVGYADLFAPPPCQDHKETVPIGTVQPKTKRSRLTDDQKARIVAMSADGKTQRDISESVGVPQATVCSVLKRHRASQGDKKEA